MNRLSRSAKEVWNRVYPRLTPKDCIYCPVKKRRCREDEDCPCPWRNVKKEVIEAIEFFNAPPPRYVRKGFTL